MSLSLSIFLLYNIIMAASIIIPALVLALYLSSKASKQGRPKKAPSQAIKKKQPTTEEEIDELITVIIPTIKNGK